MSTSNEINTSAHQQSFTEINRSLQSNSFLNTRAYLYADYSPTECAERLNNRPYILLGIVSLVLLKCRIEFGGGLLPKENMRKQ